MKTRILRIDSRNPERKKIGLAAATIRRGGLVIFPTETVYGIGGDAFNRKATRRIYEVKERPRSNPLMIHVSDLGMASKVGIFPEKYKEAVGRLWPGPIAFVVTARRGLGRKEVSVRMPDHRVALELIRESGRPIAAPSANPSKMPSSTKASHAISYFDGKVDLIIDSGQSRKGIESTILDLRTFTILRPGAFPIEEIENAFGRRPRMTRAARGLTETQKALAPGMRYRHYSPETPLFLYTGSPSSITRALGGLSGYAFIGSSESCRALRGSGAKVLEIGARDNVTAIARNLFDSLIRLDALGVRFAVVESFPEKGIGLGVMNRLRKASNHRYFSTGGELRALIKKYAKDDN